MTPILTIFSVGILFIVSALVVAAKDQKKVYVTPESPELTLSNTSKRDISKRNIVKNSNPVSSTTNNTINKTDRVSKLQNRNATDRTKKQNTYVRPTTTKVEKVTTPKVETKSVVDVKPKTEITKERKRNITKKSGNIIKISKTESKPITNVSFVDIEKNVLSDHQDKIIKLLKNEDSKKQRKKELQDNINEIDSFRMASNYEDCDTDYIPEQNYNQMFQNIINPNIHNPIRNNDNSFVLENYKKEEIDEISKEFNDMEVKKLQTLKRKTQLF